MILLGTLFAIVAVVCSFWSAASIRTISKGNPPLSNKELGSVEAKVWMALVAGTIAGSSQSWEGDPLVALVWVVFVAVQCSNLGTVRSAKRASLAPRG